jgi:hypothetical protein
LENLDAVVDINTASETMTENIKISDKKSLGYYELKKHKPWLLDKRKQAKLKWLHDPSKVNGDNLKNIRRETGRKK